MKSLVASALFLSFLSFLVSVPSLVAADKQYETGRIIDVEKKSHEKVLYYVVNTPVYQEDPYYELQLQLNNFLYRCEYTPRHAADKLPGDWMPDTEVKIKAADKRHMLVKGPDGFELLLTIVKRTPGTPETMSPKPGSVQN